MFTMTGAILENYADRWGLELVRDSKDLEKLIQYENVGGSKEVNFSGEPCLMSEIWRWGEAYGAGRSRLGLTFSCPGWG
jgi:hypothetical protein